ncbi:bifunctional glycosyltransferase/CDP-glycerol:glycerophosphate glycerophosphotransferase [Streptomyces poonensis]|uniref:bifunctional glycosyltransferase/CDP-glycerol:glycerophosphate glycerophosphotransferase n=1 Tax=Streptomyces poonensis TaxID=68255 RepID=UPI001672502F|nr:bifunctional glycosyltransferase family 2 protein/CDP-glycerol:glycerophosphate glycerophosphotransferase [Streptomyces poonensis]GLJ93487.1 glycosyl transferase [Streptomyces poonensis]
MPRFSVIVPAHGVQAYLHECLDSVLTQSFSDLELIVVDDCSPDACGAIADEYAARDPRVRPVHLPANEGLGPARNTGLDLAVGDYVLFLDGDDTLTPDALRAIADRVKETGDPDVLVYDYTRVLWSGETVRPQRATRLTEEGPAPFRLDDRPSLLSAPMAVWNKACRREFLDREGFTFPPGYYENVPWTYPVLMAAGSIATLDRSCVHYRQLRRGGILGTTSRRHFDVFEQYDRLFAYVDARPWLAHWRPALFRRMVDHLVTVFSRRVRLPRGTRAEFLRRARVHYARYRVPGVPVRGHRRLRHLLVRLGAHRTYRALSLAARAGRHGLGVLTAALRAAGRGALRLHYRVQRLLPLRADRALFSAYDGRGYCCNPGALEEAFRTYAPHVRTAWAARPEHHHTLPTATRRVVPGSVGYWTALARAKYLVTNAEFDTRLVKRAGQVMVQTQAGTPVKRMGLDLRGRPAAARGTDTAGLLCGADQWDFVLSGNRHSTLVWERVFPAGYETLEYGLPRNDVFQRATSMDVDRLRASLGVPEGAIAVLYAPTYRDHRSGPRTALDLERVLRRLGPRFVLLARAHHADGAPPDARAYDAPAVRAAGGRLLDVTGHPSVEHLCLASDALITDYSSLMFDYANLDRPIVLLDDDREAYEAARGTYRDSSTSSGASSFPPGAVARGEDELIDIFATGHWRGSRSTQLRAAFRARFCPYDDGHAAERVVRRVVLGETEIRTGTRTGAGAAGLPPVVPLAERRPVPSPAERPTASVPGPAGSFPPAFPSAFPPAFPSSPETVTVPGGRVAVHDAL